MELAVQIITDGFLRTGHAAWNAEMHAREIVSDLVAGGVTLGTLTREVGP